MGLLSMSIGSLPFGMLALGGLAEWIGPNAAVVASGRSDYPNQINNVLAFPGVFRGLLDARARDITIEMLLRAADAIAHVVRDEELNPNFIIPTVFNSQVPKAVAAAIRGAGSPDA